MRFSWLRGWCCRLRRPDPRDVSRWQCPSCGQRWESQTEEYPPDYDLVHFWEPISAAEAELDAVC